MDNTFTYFNQIVTPSVMQSQFSTVAGQTLSSLSSYALPNIYGQNNRIISAHGFGTGFSKTNFFKVEAYGRTLSATDKNATTLFGTLYSSLAGSGSGVFPGALLNDQLPTDCWLRITPSSTIEAIDNPAGAVGLCVNYLKVDNRV